MKKYFSERNVENIFRGNKPDLLISIQRVPKEGNRIAYKTLAKEISGKPTQNA